MNRNLKAILTGLMILAVILVGIACSKNNAEPETSAAPTAAPAATAAPTAAPTEAPVDPFMKFDPPIEMSVGQIVGGVLEFPEGESPEDNIAYTIVRDNIGINLTPKFTAPNGGPYFEKLKLLIASNDIPDLAFASAAEMATLVKGDMVEDLAPYYEKYASERLKKIMGYRDGVAFSQVKKDDKIYAMPSMVDGNNAISLMYIRQDWLDALKLPMPATMEEVFEVAKAFVKDDPDQDGKDNTLGIVISKELNTGSSYPLWAIMNAYGVYPSTASHPMIMVKDETGKLTYGSTVPKAKEVLQILNGLYKEGVFDKEFAVKDFNKVTETVAAGTVGIQFGEFWSPLWPLADTIKNNEKADWVAFAVPGAEGKPFVPYAPLNTQGYYFVKKGYAHPEALIIALNHLAETLYDDPQSEYAKAWIPTVQSEKYKTLSIHAWLPFFVDRADKNSSYSANIVAAREKKDGSGLGAAEKQFYDDFEVGGIANWPMMKIYLNSMPEIAKYSTLKFNDYMGATTKTMTEKRAVLDQLELETYTGIITGGKSIDEFDKFVEQWKSLGGDQIIAEVNE